MVTTLSVKKGIKTIVQHHVENQACEQYKEQDTLYKMIFPFLRCFGWSEDDVFAQVYVPGTPGVHGFVDMTLRIGGINGEDQIVLEAKRPSFSDLSQAIEQLEFYFNNSKAHIGILTNGIEYWFFSWAERTPVMDRRPFARINIKHLDLFVRDNFVMRLRKHKFDIRLMKWYSHADFIRWNIYRLLSSSHGGNNSTLAFDNFKAIFSKYKLDGEELDIYYLKDMFEFTKHHSRYNYEHGKSEW